MSGRNLEVTAVINNTPDAVLSYVADVRNRPLYLPQLKSVADVKGAPGPGQSWKWTFLALGMEFEGLGRCLDYVPGKHYKFATEGGIASTWTYSVAPEGTATRLNVNVEYTVPDKAKSILPADNVLDSMKKAEADKAVKNLKTILDK